MKERRVLGLNIEKGEEVLAVLFPVLHKQLPVIGALAVQEVGAVEVVAQFLLLRA